MSGRGRGPNPWLVLLVGAILGIPVAWAIFNLVLGLLVGLGS
jgi:hypothetical protein